MSYQGGSTPRTDYWSGNVAPDAYRQNPNPQILQARSAPQYHPPTNQQADYWSPNNQTHNGNMAGTSNHSYYPQAPSGHQFQQPQFISPSQLLQQQPSAQQYQRTPSLNRQPSNALVRNTSSVAPSIPMQPEPDTAMLLISLAEEYFEEAHKLAPSVARFMTPSYVAAYEQLIATGLGCLDTALKRVRLTPRIEANIRLRYAGVLYEETDNDMEAETTLIQGIALCERNHYYDLKYAMQFLLARFMAKKNTKASMKALDSHISEAELYRHYPWVYAFRFLRASLASTSGTIIDNKAVIQNLQAIARLAEKLDDRAIHLTASLMEAMTFMRSPGPDALEQMQGAIAAAWGHQMDSECRIPQLQCLAHMIDVVCSIRQGQPLLMREKLKNMRDAMDSISETKAWSSSSDVIAVPIRRTPKSSHVVSHDTRMVLGIGSDGGDNLMISFLNQKDASAISLLLGGFVLQQGTTASDKMSGTKYLQEGIVRLENDDPRTGKEPATCLLPELISRRLWRGQTLCYTRIYLAFYYASLAEWAKVETIIGELNKTIQLYEISLATPPGHLMMYLTGIYHQGIGDLDTALQIFQDKRFDLDKFNNPINMSLTNQLDQDIAILAALNTIWILQHPQLQSLSNNATLIDKLAPFCEKHSNNDIKAAFSLVLATVKTQPAGQMIHLKFNMNAALSSAQKTKNFQILSITLSVMCSKFFDNIMGAQAEKSAQAASLQSKASGNPLWMSVADGMLAKCYELQGKTAEAQKTMAVALKSAEKVLPDSEEGVLVNNIIAPIYGCRTPVRLSASPLNFFPAASTRKPKHVQMLASASRRGPAARNLHICSSCLLNINLRNFSGRLITDITSHPANIAQFSTSRASHKAEDDSSRTENVPDESAKVIDAEHEEFLTRPLSKSKATLAALRASLRAQDNPDTSQSTKHSNGVENSGKLPEEYSKSSGKGGKKAASKALNPKARKLAALRAAQDDPGANTSTKDSKERGNIDKTAEEQGQKSNKDGQKAVGTALNSKAGKKKTKRQRNAAKSTTTKKQKDSDEMSPSDSPDSSTLNPSTPTLPLEAENANTETHQAPTGKVPKIHKHMSGSKLLYRYIGGGRKVPRLPIRKVASHNKSAVNTYESELSRLVKDGKLSDSAKAAVINALRATSYKSSPPFSTLKDALQGRGPAQARNPEVTPGTDKKVDPLAPAHLLPKRMQGHDIETVSASDIKLTPVDKDQLDVPSLSYGLERVLFNPGVYQLQDPRSRVFNFDPYLQTIMPVSEFDFSALKAYITSSRDETLLSRAKQEGKKYTGSTSSMSASLAHFHFLLSQWRPVNTGGLSKTFPVQYHTFTQLQRAPVAIFLRWKDGVYAIDADKEFDSGNILMSLGKSMEKLLTSSTENFEKYRKENSHQVTEAERNDPEPFHYSTLGDFLLRSQLDAHDPRLPGTGMFDLKTRAVISIRMDTSEYEVGRGYEIRSRHGEWQSYEREYYDMIRAAFLKYSMQVRMGRMDGIFVAFHNTERIFGFQYINLSEMDYCIHGTDDLTLGDSEFKLSLDLLNRVLDRATAKFPEKTLRLHFETRGGVTPFMYIYAEPIEEEEVDKIQSTNREKIEKFEKEVLGLGVDEDEWANMQKNVETGMVIDEIDPEELNQDGEEPSAIWNASQNEETEDDEGFDEDDDLSMDSHDENNTENEPAPDVIGESSEDNAIHEDVKSGDFDNTKDEVKELQRTEALDLEAQEDLQDEGEDEIEQEIEEILQGNIPSTPTEAESSGLTEEITETEKATLPESSTAYTAESDSQTNEPVSELLAMTLTIRNKVNGKYVERPENLTKDDDWVVEYSLAEISDPARGQLLLKQTKSRRAKTFNRSLDLNDSYNDKFVKSIQKCISEGRKYREEINEIEKDLPKRVLGMKDSKA